MAADTVFIATPTIYPEALHLLESETTVMWGVAAERRGIFSGPEIRTLRTEIAANLHAAAGEVDAIFGYYPYDRDLIESASRLRVIMTPSAGADNVDLEAATRRGVSVITAVGAAYGPVAEHAIGLSLSLLKRIAEGDRDAHLLRRQRPVAEIFPGRGQPSMLGGKTIGIIGYGFIGRELARIAREGFRMQVLAFDPYFDAVEAARQGVTLVDDLHELLGQSDVVSVNCPLTAATKGLIGMAEFEIMKPSAVLINCARGTIVITDDLVAALELGQIAGAGLDVTDPEPLPDNHALLSFGNVVLTPHIGGVARETRPQQDLNVVRDGLMALRGRQPFHLANPQAWTQKGSS